MTEQTYDLAIVGGGVNGCGIARDAAGRGLSVLLVERDDLASGTSSASTKLIHGGLRYLEHYEFRLVRESLREREVLWRSAPHIIKPMRFVLPHHRELRPAWLIRLGLFLYDHLGGRDQLPGCRSIDLRSSPTGDPLKSEFQRGFEYSDCWVDDARLVVLAAMDAREHGATIRTRTEFVDARRETDAWRVSLSNAHNGTRSTVTCRALVNAAGPWVAEVAGNRIRSAAKAPVRLVKGSHIVVPRLFVHDKAYIFQNSDGRIVFAIPYEDEFTLVGTTDVDLDGGSAETGWTASTDEVSYLCKAVGGYFAQKVSTGDVVWSYSGVRPLYDQGGGSAQKATRDYHFELNAEGSDAPLLNVIGGKITTFRELAEEALRKLRPWFPKMGPHWTRHAVLPGGDLSATAFADFVDDLRNDYPDFPENMLMRMAQAYGTRIRNVLGDARSLSDMGNHFGAGLYAVEVEYLIRAEWAESVDDIIWRRSKLGLRLNPEDTEALSQWLSKDTAADRRAGARR